MLSAESGKPSPSRPVVSGNTGLNCHLSELLSQILEPINSESSGAEIDSTCEMLKRIEDLNVKFKNKSIFEAKTSVDVPKQTPVDERTNPVIESKHVDLKHCKSDIRLYGRVGHKSIKSKVETEKSIKENIERMRKSKSDSGLLLNLADRVKASYLMDIIEDNKPIKLPNSLPKNGRRIQKSGPENLCISGADVVSLFPSLKNIEAGRLARHAILNSNVKFDNINYLMALRYINLVGGRELLSKAGLGHLAPTWNGKREDLTTVGGKKSKDGKNWIDSKREIMDSEKRKVVAMVVKILVNLIMSSHVYCFGGKFYLQADGGPICLRSTACLAALIMSLWDIAWQKLIEWENLDVHLSFRYVDDYRNFLQALMEGWRWNGVEFQFKPEWEIEDLESGVSDQHRTTLELTKAMSSLVCYLKFEGEEAGMFSSNKLPTLDTAIWWENNQIMHEVFEKDMCPNKVLQKSTALSTELIRASLNQEVVRHLLCCSQNLPLERKDEILSIFAQKLINSRFSLRSSQLILVHGTSRYVTMLKNSKLNPDKPKFKPLYWDKSYRKLERKLAKFDGKAGWYKQSDKISLNWRNSLPSVWKGTKPTQIRVPGMQFSTVLQVPSSKDSRLIREITKLEPRLVKSSGYHTKLVEKSGKPLSKMFSKSISNPKCHREDCAPCGNEKIVGSSLCQSKNIVYESVCVQCDDVHIQDPTKQH